MSHFTAPSILAGDFGCLKKDVEMLNASQADWIHVDIMDGVFVPNISFGFPVLEAINRYATKPLDVHLMIVNPDRYISRFKEAGATNLIVHIEACAHLHRTIQQIHLNEMKVGVALNPHTAINNLESIIQDIDHVLIMSVNPGFGGQKFIPSVIEKTKKLKELIKKRNPNCLIEVDGGVNDKNIHELKEAGVDVVVAGSYVFGNDDYSKAIKSLQV